MALPTLYRTGLLWAREPNDIANDVIVYKGNCRSDDDTEDIELSSSMVKRLDASWTAGTNQGGLRSGETRLANVWYYIYVIKDVTNNVVDVLLTSLEPGNVNFSLPAGYTKKRLIGAIRLNSTNLQNIDTRYVNGNIYLRYIKPSDNNLTSWSLDSQDKTDRIEDVPALGSAVYKQILFHANVRVSRPTFGAPDSIVYPARAGRIDPTRSITTLYPFHPSFLSDSMTFEFTARLR